MQGNGIGEAIGSITIWPTADWKQDMKAADGKPDHYLVCNGQMVNAIKYPKLAKIMSNVPDYQGLFLRGYGSQNFAQENGSRNGVTSTLYSSGNIGNIQGDAIRNLSGKMYGSNSGAAGLWDKGDGIFSTFNTGRYAVGTALEYFSYVAEGMILSSSYITPTANEIRPVNTAVIYLIRAK